MDLAAKLGKVPLARHYREGKLLTRQTSEHVSSIDSFFSDLGLFLSYLTFAIILHV
jgi:hypothetical protein